MGKDCDLGGIRDFVVVEEVVVTKLAVPFHILKFVAREAAYFVDDVFVDEHFAYVVDQCAGHKLVEALAIKAQNAAENACQHCHVQAVAVGIIVIRANVYHVYDGLPVINNLFDDVGHNVFEGVDVAYAALARGNLHV